MVATAPHLGIQDPVCKMALTPSNLTHMRLFEGEPVYFCSDMCADKFDRDPMRYMGDVIQRVRLPLSGLSCASQAVGLEDRMRGVLGVIEAMVNPVTEIAYVTYDSRLVDIPQLREAIGRAGFQSR